MKKKSFLKIIAVFVLVTVISVSTCIFADVGNINRYSGGSSSSSSHSSSSHSSRSSSYSGSSHSGSDYSSSSSEGGGSIWGLIVGIIIVGVVIFVTSRANGKTNNKYTDALNNLVNGSTDSIKTNTKGIADEIRQTDPEFSEEKFLSWTKDVFVKLQAAWTARDWKIIRPFESNELFEQHNAQLQEYINNNRINMIERVAVESADLMSHKVDGDKEIIEVYLKAVMKDYIIDATTKEVVEGNKNTDWHMRYKLTFIRKNGVKTHAGTSNKSTTNCPNCGAPTEITSAGQCEYCGSVITTGEHDWVLSGLEGIK